jgi:phosphoribosylformylglycinamidine cyclo-ligase
VKDSYAKSGVDIDAGNDAVRRYRALLGSRRDPRVLEGIGGFGGCFELRGYERPVLVASTDGVGTKVLVAAALRRFDTIGRDLVNHCINDIACMNARPLFFLDYLAVGKLDASVAASIVAGIAASCEEYGLALLGGETAEMPGVYAEDHFDLAGTIVGALEREAMPDSASVVAGDAVIGLPANGFHTNGYSLVRHTLDRSRWSDKVDGSTSTVADAMLAVHPCYLPYIDAIRASGVAIKAMAHITGGGLLDNVERVLPDHLAARFDRSKWTVPALVAQVAREARLTDDEAYRTFNMGVGFCIVVSGGDASKALAAANAALSREPIAGAAQHDAAIVGEIEPRHQCGPAVIITPSP